MDLSYAEQQLLLAMLSLVGDAEDLPLRKRLFGAALALQKLNEQDFRDKDTAKNWERIFEDLTLGSEPEYPGEGRIEATTRNLLDHDAEDIAKRMLDLFVDVLRPPIPTREG